MSAKKKHPEVEKHRNKIFEVLVCLDETEHKRLRKFLHSPFFIKTKTLASLYEVLLASVERGDSGFDRQAVWREIQPEMPFDAVVFRKYCSDLLKWTEVFMAHERQIQQENLTTVAQLDFLVDRKIKPLYDRSIREARSHMVSKPFRSLDDFFTAYKIERSYYAMMDFEVSVNKRTNIEDISRYLDVFYWIEKLKLFGASLSQQRTSRHEYDLHGMSEMVATLQKFPVEEIPELAVYYYCFLTLYEAENEAHYFKLRELIAKHIPEMPRQEAVEIIDSALHYCTGRFNRGQSQFYQEYFDLVDLALEKGIFSKNSEFAPWRYNNIVGVALRLDKLDWAERFVEDFKPVLPSDSRQNTYTFNLARVYRFQKQYPKVIALLRDVEYEDIGYNLISKMMLTITYYELEEYDALSPFLDAFTRFLNRNEKKIPEQRRIGYLNLLHYVRLLMRLIPGDKSGQERIRQAIEKDKAAIINHEWLLEKLNGMS